MNVKFVTHRVNSTEKVKITDIEKCLKNVLLKADENCMGNVIKIMVAFHSYLYNTNVQNIQLLFMYSALQYFQRAKKTINTLHLRYYT